VNGFNLLRFSFGKNDHFYFSVVSPCNDFRSDSLVKDIVCYFKVLLLVLLVGLLTSSWVFAEGELDYRLGVGDKVKVTVYGHPELSGELSVNGSGAITMPLIAEVDALGLNTYQLARRITDRLRPDYLVNPRVTIELMSYRPYYIMGEVKRSGSYPYVEGMTVLNAIALAGGYTPRAKKKGIVIERKGAQGKKKFKARGNSLVIPGDIIIIKERFF
jgi:polysaccharide export outer membrane protein